MALIMCSTDTWVCIQQTFSYHWCMTDWGLGTFMLLMTNSNIYGVCDVSSVPEEELNKISLFID